MMSRELEIASVLAAAAATVVGIVALLFAVYTHSQLRRSEKRSACFALHQLWFAPHLLEARGYAARICDDALRGTIPLEAHAADEKFSASVSHVEHFIVDLGCLLQANVVSRELAHALFSATVERWIERLGNTVYAQPCLRSFHLGKDPDKAFNDFTLKIVPVKKFLEKGSR
jgi:hypothetical protein